MTHAAGQKLVNVECSDLRKVQCFAYRNAEAITLWLANLTTEKHFVNVAGLKSGTLVSMLDEASFGNAATDPRGFQATCLPLKGTTIAIDSYAVACISVNN